jgi:DNA polymerase elongation subunit (family B)
MYSIYKSTMPAMDKSFRLLDFNIYDEVREKESSSGSGSGSDTSAEFKYKQDTKRFVIQMFGINEKGETFCLFVNDYKPFFYVKVGDDWNIDRKNEFLNHIKTKIGKYYENSICECKIINRKKLYGFDGGKEHKFILLKFNNTIAMNKVKNFYYQNGTNGRRLIENGYVFQKTETYLYEANIPPLLRYFHIKEISPSGWICIPLKKAKQMTEKKTSCMYEFEIGNNDIIPLNNKETVVPYKICSFDIEASSSHGDFPVPIKSYKKLATSIMEYYDGLGDEISKGEITKIIKTAFGYDDLTNIDKVYPKTAPSLQGLNRLLERLYTEPIKDLCKVVSSENTIERMFEKMSANLNDEDDDDVGYDKRGSKIDLNTNIIDLINNSTIKREEKVDKITDAFKGAGFPQLEGDKVTFIGSTFLKYGDEKPYLNNCVVLNTCSKVDEIENSEIVSYDTERELLLAWKNLILKEDPDIIIGYNIFGFDYQFIHIRARENDCEEEFLKLSRNVNEICGTKNEETGRINIEESKIVIASGEHDLKFIKMNGRLQVDMYNYFRRDYNLTSYKLDYVSGYFIGDDVKKLEHIHDSAIDADTEVDAETYDSNTIEITKIFSKNLTGLENGSYINFEETSHSTDYYKEGQKFKVSNVNKEAGTFEIKGHESPDMTKQVKWGLAKDDVTPQDIFRMTNEGPNERAIIAKYCIQDCNLVHHLMNKIDVMTGYSEMAKICSVPINFLVMRGQGIKLTSYIAKKCREKRTLMPVLEKPLFDDGYEGAIVLDPKCNLYLDNPVACVDYSSLYPSSMISENLSHDSKVWTKEYDLNRNKIRETGEKDDKGKFKYDNLPGYEYVDVEYDTFKWIPNARGKSEKTHSGTKVCRFAQFPEGRAIMPSILEELLASRKATRKLIPLQTDEFMKNILDKRQTSYKLTANSLYGQCGAKTSTFYEKDVAASCTAIGRKLLTYAKRVIEETYGDVIVETKFGKVHSNAEYVYGDSVAKYTPVYVKVDGKLQIVEMEKLAQQYGGNQWTTCIEEGKQEKEFCELYGVETWTDKGWTKLHRIIRHQLASHKKMIRILTHTGMVDVTDDHSLVLEDGNEISPKEVDIGTKLLHKTLEEYESPQFEVENNINTDMAKIYGFFFGDGSCGIYDCPSGKKASWALNNADGELLDKYINLCRTCYPEFDWQIYDTIESSGVYKITFNGGVYGNKSKFIETYREHMYSGKSKIIPDFILNGTRDIREAFWEGLYDADGDKDKNGYVRIDQKNQISAAQICWLANSIGYKTSVNTRTDKQNIYRITATKGSQRKVGNAIKKLMELDYHDYVYDLTTENHHFAAGIGNMIVHNTDSVFFTFNLKTPEGEDIRGHKALEITIELAKEAGHMASKFLKKPHDLEYEKTFMPFCLLSKKRYVGMLYENDPDKGTRKSMGIVLKRRDNAPIVKDVYGGIIDILMKEKNIQKAVEFLQTSLQNIIEEKYPMEKLIITKSLRSNYKNPQQIAHKVLADRMGKRDPGNKPSSGDRIPFVYIETKNKNCLQGEKIEHPEYILKNKIRPNYSFYITNQIMKPVQQVFALVLEDIDAFKRKKRNFQMQVDTLKNTIDDADKLSAKIDDLRHKEVKLLLFDKYLRETDNMKNKMKSITSFFA